MQIKNHQILWLYRTTLLFRVLRHLSKSTSGDHTKHTLLQETKTADDVFEVLAQTMRYLNQPSDKTIFDNKDVVRSSWQEVIDAAERHNNPENLQLSLLMSTPQGVFFRALTRIICTATYLQELVCTD